MKYLWRIYLWFMVGCKPPASKYLSLSHHIKCDHNLAVLSSSTDLLDLIRGLCCLMCGKIDVT